MRRIVTWIDEESPFERWSEAGERATMESLPKAACLGVASCQLKVRSRKEVCHVR